LKTQFRKKTVGQNNDEFITSSSKELINNLNEERVSSENKIKDFLCEFQSDFPIYSNGSSESFNTNIEFT